jgi:mono/diheme cytochrome c family protein
MRHLLANLAVYVLATGLVVGSVLFAWIRSQQIVIATEPMIEPPEYFAAGRPEEFDWEDFGRQVYIANCKNCHGLVGGGRDVYPGLVGQIDVFAAPGGREYLSRVIVYGLATPRQRAPMPPMPHLSDAQIAAVNNYVLTRFDHAARLPDELQLFVPRDVRRVRGEDLSERDVGRMRPDVPPAGALSGEQ